jgi:hypothetical protein
MAGRNMRAPRLTDDPYLLVKVILVVALINFGSFQFVSLIAGGDGLNGIMREGHCFFANDGKLTEVSCVWWQWSRFHALSLYFTHFFAITACIVGWLHWKGFWE